MACFLYNYCFSMDMLKIVNDDLGDNLYQKPTKKIYWTDHLSTQLLVNIQQNDRKIRLLPQFFSKRAKPITN